MVGEQRSDAGGLRSAAWRRDGAWNGGAFRSLRRLHARGGGSLGGGSGWSSLGVGGMSECDAIGGADPAISDPRCEAYVGIDEGGGGCVVDGGVCHGATDRVLNDTRNITHEECLRR